MLHATEIESIARDALSGHYSRAAAQAASLRSRLGAHPEAAVWLAIKAGSIRHNAMLTLGAVIKVWRSLFTAQTNALTTRRVPCPGSKEKRVFFAAKARTPRAPSQWSPKLGLGADAPEPSGEKSGRALRIVL